jgi:hypothetical protein
MRSDIVVVALNGPRRPRMKRGGEVRMEFCPRRVVWSTWLAKLLDCPLIVCGDANGGEDLRRMERFAKMRGAPHVIARRNGLHKNTDGDCFAAATVVEEMPEVKRVVLVTCSYHVVRAWLKLGRHCRNTVHHNVSVFGLPIPTNPLYAASHWVGECKGILGELLGRQIGSNRHATGEKPDLDAA